MIPLWDKLTRPILFWIFALIVLTSRVAFRLAELTSGRSGRRRYPDHVREKLKAKTGRRPSNLPPTPSEKIRPFISIVVPVFNAEETLEFCLDSLVRQSWPASLREIIVVDNMSTDRSREIASQYDVRLEACSFRGPSATRNTGVEAANGTWVAFIDSDCIAAPHWLERLAEAATSNRDADENVVMTGGEVRGLYFGNVAMRDFGNAAGLLDQASAVAGGMLGLPFVITANAMVWREEFMRQGGFDPALGPGEDSEFGWRLSFAGRKVAFAPEAKVWHFHRLDAKALHRQYFAYGCNEVAAAIKWQSALTPEVYSRLAWFRPYEYRMFWKHCAQMGLALLLFNRSKFLFCFYFNTSILGHFAGQLWAHFKHGNLSGFALYPELLDPHDNES